MKKIPFGIELYNTGKYDVVTNNSVTNDNTPVEILTTNGRDPDFPVLCYKGNNRIISALTKFGRYNKSNVPNNIEDIFLVEKVTFEDKYVSIFINSKETLTIGGLMRNIESLIHLDDKLTTLKLRIFSTGDVEILETIKNNS